MHIGNEIRNLSQEEATKKLEIQELTKATSKIKNPLNGLSSRIEITEDSH